MRARHCNLSKLMGRTNRQDASANDTAVIDASLDRLRTQGMLADLLLTWAQAIHWCMLSCQKFLRSDHRLREAMYPVL